MTALVGLFIVVALTVPWTIWLGRRSPVDRAPVAWDLADQARRQITILSGQAAVAVTAVVFLVTTLRAAGTEPAFAFNTVVAMFLVAFLSFVGVAVQFGLMPVEDRTEGTLLPRFLTMIAGLQHYRTLFLAWLALKPLVDTFGLADAGRLLEWLLGMAAMAGWLVVASVVHRMGFLSLREAFATPALGVILSAVYAMFVRGSEAAGMGAEALLALTVAIFGLNAATFTVHALAPIIWRRRWGHGSHELLARAYLLADLQATVVSLTLIWAWLLGPY